MIVRVPDKIYDDWAFYGLKTRKQRVWDSVAEERPKIWESSKQGHFYTGAEPRLAGLRGSESP
jgi:hypothetical protein